jgi:hypothetical protein
VAAFAYDPMRAIAGCGPPRRTKALAYLHYRLAMLRREWLIKPAIRILDAHEGLCLIVSLFYQQAISGGLDQVGLIGSNRRRAFLRSTGIKALWSVRTTTSNFPLNP